MSRPQTHPDPARPEADAANAPDGAPPPRSDGPVDYKSLYDNYWSRPDRWGSHSFADAEPIAEQILTSCGPGRILDVGCGMGLLVRTLLRKGIDARGVDVAAQPVARANELAPGRFQTGSILHLPFDDASFDTITSTDCLEHIAEADVPRALAELHRVARRAVFIRVAVTPDRDGVWHLTVRPRHWWEEQFFNAGFSRHPLSQRIVAFEALDDEGWQVTLVMQKLPRPAGYPDDMLSRPGREAEAALARSTRIAWFIRPGDLVLDITPEAAASGAVLASQSNAQRIIAAGDGATIDAAKARFGHLGLPLDLRTPDAIAKLEDRSVGLINAAGASVDDALLAEFRRILVPGGRLVLGGPVGAPPPAIPAGYLHERSFSQSLGSESSSRALRVIEPGHESGDWWMRILSTDVVGATRAGYVERSFPDYSHEPAFNIGNYARDHDNPWLLRAMISMGMRTPNRALVAETAARVLETARPGSADQGAALCVLAYRLLEQDDLDPAHAGDMTSRLEAFIRQAEATPHAQRWAISNQYVLAQLLLARGQFTEARAAFEACANMDVLAFSPLLASKTIDACFYAGLIAANAHDRAGARALWERGLHELHRVLHHDWLNIWGAPERPMPFGLPDVGIMIDGASRCASGLIWLDEWDRRPGLAWTWTLQRTLSDHRRWIARLEETRDWLDKERGRFRSLAQERAKAIERLRIQAQRSVAENHRLRNTIERREQRIQALDQALQRSRERLSSFRSVIEDLRRHIASLGEARDWLTTQVESRDRALAELRDSFAQSRLWLEDQLARARATVAERDATIENLKSWAARLSSAKETLQQRLESAIAAKDAEIARLRRDGDTLRQWAADLLIAKETLASASDKAAARARERQATIAELRRRLARAEGENARLAQELASRALPPTAAPGSASPRCAPGRR